MTHYIAHQQALIKNNICIAVLAFTEHDEFLMQETFAKFDYDIVVNLCEVQKDAALGASWDGQDFNTKPYDSWNLGEDLKWHSPESMPDDGKTYFWNNESISWEEETDPRYI